ncbi:MAG: aminopeptidase [Candidatus Micrarchaeota archaeon]|nr:aminopeptidase [Candidatus Micrarchaeota archaeon]
MVEKQVLKRAAVKLLRENIKLKRGEKVVLVTDRHGDPIHSALLQAATELGGVIREQRIRAGRQHSSPIPEARKTLLWADVLLAPVDSSITHCDETVAAMKKGLRGASMPGIYPELFAKLLTADAEKVAWTNEKIVNALRGAREVRITSPSGSDFTLSVEGRRPGRNGPDLSRKGSVTNIPFGEVFVAPVENRGDGSIVFDAWHLVRGKICSGAIAIKKGRIAGWDPGAKPYVDYLRKAGSCGFTIAELGFGTNPAHKKPVGNVLHDEKIYGSAHVAFGQNVSFGGRNRCGVHEDVVILKPTVWVDGEKAVDKGKII